MFCPNCGTKIGEGTFFCPSCGEQVRENLAGSQVETSSSTEVKGQITNSSQLKQNEETNQQKSDITNNMGLNSEPSNNSYLDPSNSEIKSNQKKQMPKPVNQPKSKQNQKSVAVDNAVIYYLAALFWPIGLILFLNIRLDKPKLAKQMREIMMFSGLLTLFFWWIGAFDNPGL